MSRGSGELRNSSPPLLQKTTTTTTSFSGEWVLRRETTYFASRLRFFEKGGKRERESVDDARQLLASTETNSCWFEVNEPSHNSVFPFLSFFLFSWKLSRILRLKWDFRASGRKFHEGNSTVWSLAERTNGC